VAEGGPMNDSQHLRNEIARTGLLNIQHWFDHGSELVAHGVLGDWPTIVIMAERHLIEVNAALRDGAREEAVAIQLDATIKATNQFWYSALAWCNRQRTRMDRALERAMDRIYEKLDQVRWQLDPPEVIELTHARAKLADDVYEAMAVPPVFELIRREAEHAALELAGKDAHVTTIVERVTRELELRIEHARFLLDVYDGDDSQFEPLVIAARSAVDALYRGIGERVRVPARARLDRVIAALAAMGTARAAA
jgi:hypothetical protein